MDGGSESHVGFVVTGGDSPEYYDFLEQILGQVVPFVHLLIIGNFFAPTGVEQDSRQYAALVWLDTQPGVVKGALAGEYARPEAAQQRFSDEPLVALPGRGTKRARLASASIVACQEAALRADIVRTAGRMAVLILAKRFPSHSRMRRRL